MHRKLLKKIEKTAIKKEKEEKSLNKRGDIIRNFL